MSFDGFGGDGHAFSEAYDSTARQWIFVDPLNGFYAADQSTGRPLSVLEFRERLIADEGFESLIITPIGEAFRFDSPRDAFNYYKRGADQFYLWFGNHVFTYDAHPIVRLFGPVSRAMEQLAAILVGLHPDIKIFATASNQSDITALKYFRYRVLAFFAATLAFGLVAVLQSVKVLRQLRH